MASSPFTKLFLFASLWSLAGAAFGFFNTSFTFELIFIAVIADAVFLALFAYYFIQLYSGTKIYAEQLEANR